MFPPTLPASKPSYRTRAAPAGTGRCHNAPHMRYAKTILVVRFNVSFALHLEIEDGKSYALTVLTK